MLAHDEMPELEPPPERQVTQTPADLHTGDPNGDRHEQPSRSCPITATE
jgi:hypothetical protein